MMRRRTYGPLEIALTLASVAAAVLPAPALAWVPWDAAGDCPYSYWQRNAGIELRWATGNSFTTAEKDVIRSSLQQFNQLNNGRIYVYEGTAGCTFGGAQQLNVLCVTETTAAESICGSGALACTLREEVDEPSCTHDWCEINFVQQSGALNVPRLWASVAHEFSHCMGLWHSPNTRDWMAAASNLGAANMHVGMTRDTMNGLNAFQPFGTNFYFGNFNISPDTDILTRDNQLVGDTVPWYLTGQNSFSEGWDDVGQVMSDHGDENTIAYLFGHFTGNTNCPDAARGLCVNCDPNDGVGDTIDWNVKPSDCAGGFSGSQDWMSDFGNGEDYDQYKVGDFDGDGCDDVWLIRNASARTCTGGTTCKVQIHWMLSRRPNGNSCAGSGATPDHFVIHSTYHEFEVDDRSAEVAWPWVVGDFHKNNGLGCDDLAYGVGSQSDPRILEWRVLKANDTNANGLCDTLAEDGTWEADFGELGLHYVFAAEAGTPGTGSGDDLIRVKLTVEPGVQEASWHVTYGDGIDAFTNTSEVLTDHLVTGAEAHWTGMVFGVGNFNNTGSDGGIDLITLRGANASGPVKAKIAFRAPGSGSWALDHYSADDVLPTAKAAWDQVSEDMPDGVLDDGGDDASGTWWCTTCDEWYCSVCSGCCP